MRFLGRFDRRIIPGHKKSHYVYLPSSWWTQIEKYYPEEPEEVIMLAGEVLIIAPKEIDDEILGKCYRFLESLEPYWDELKDWKPP